MEGDTSTVVKSEIAEPSASKDQTFILIKPEEVHSGRADQIIAFIDEYCRQNGLTYKITSGKITKEMAERHWLGRGDDFIRKVGKKAANALIEKNAMTKESEDELGKRVLKVHALAWEDGDVFFVHIAGLDAFAKIDKIKGSTDPSKAAPDTIRGRFSTGMTFYDAITEQQALRNIVHIPESVQEWLYDMKTFERIAQSEMKQPFADRKLHHVVCALPMIITPTSQHIVLAKRKTSNNDLYPGQMNTITGHVSGSERYESAIKRKIEQELGVTADKITLRELGPITLEDGSHVFVAETFVAMLDPSILEDPKRYLRPGEQHSEIEIIPFENMKQIIEKAKLTKPEQIALERHHERINAHVLELRNAMSLGRGLQPVLEKNARTLKSI